MLVSERQNCTLYGACDKVTSLKSLSSSTSIMQVFLFSVPAVQKRRPLLGLGCPLQGRDIGYKLKG